MSASQPNFHQSPEPNEYTSRSSKAKYLSASYRDREDFLYQSEGTRSRKESPDTKRISHSKPLTQKDLEPYSDLDPSTHLIRYNSGDKALRSSHSD